MKTHELSLRATAALTGSNGPNEDVSGVQSNTAWVIDGATDLLEPLDLPADSNAEWYANHLHHFIHQNAGAPTLEMILWRALEGLDEEAQGLVGDEILRFPSAAVMLVRLDGREVEYLTLADCHLLVEKSDGSFQHVGPTGIPGPLPLSEMKRRRLTRNTTEGLWVARREPHAVNHAEKGVIDMAARVLLATDGAWRAFESGLVSSYREFIQMTSGELTTVLGELRSLDFSETSYWDDGVVTIFEVT